MRLFRKAADFAALEKVLEETFQRTGIRILAYCIMSNHWHLLLWPREDGELSQVMRWLTVTHTQRWHANRHTSGSGPIYQGRFKSFPVQSDEHLLTVARYIERNPLRAKMVDDARAWQWSSLWRRCQGDPALRAILSDWPVEIPRDWASWVQQPQTEAELRGRFLGATDRQKVRFGVHVPRPRSPPQEAAAMNAPTTTSDPLYWSFTGPARSLMETSIWDELDNYSD
jgi:putative transposase